MTEHSTAKGDMRAMLTKLIQHFEHVLPAQAPISDFVHHNTLHGFQHLSFEKGVAAARDITGAEGFLPESEFRKLLSQKRITEQDLVNVFNNTESLQPSKSVLDKEQLKLIQRDFYLTAFTKVLTLSSASQLHWEMAEFDVFNRFHSDVSNESRQRFLERSGKDEATSVNELWLACLGCLELEHFILHPEELTDLSTEQADKMIEMLNHEEDETLGEQPMLHLLMRKEATRRLDEHLALIGIKDTMGSFLKSITGEDVMENIRPLLIRQLGNFLDQGISAWKSNARGQGFYKAWLENAEHDLSWLLDDLPEWRDELELLTDDPYDTIEFSLRQLGLDESRWGSYLERLSLELPGWSGMFLWRHQHPGYEGHTDVKVDMVDYLAVRLVLERIFTQRLCRKYWRLEANIDMIRWYLRRRRSEFYVRHALYNERLPEYLTDLTQQHVNRKDHPASEYDRWKQLANMIWTWRNSPAAERRDGYDIVHSAWPLFLAAQHLGMAANDVLELEDEQLAQIFNCINLDKDTRSFIWLQAYENHYRDQLFTALVNNHARGTWETRASRPSGQIVFCMDDREESIRRHLEEINPTIETFGAAGFFGVAINWQGLDDEKLTPLCPIVVTPAHNVYEKVQSGKEKTEQTHVKRRSQRLRIKDLFHQEIRRNVLTSAILILFSSPAVLINLMARILAPYTHGNVMNKMRIAYDRIVPTQVNINSDNTTSHASVETPQTGFTDDEQADRVANFLRVIGLTSGFAPIVSMMGHGSGSQNNPHLSAYDCGACSGRHGGPNARVFAAMANRPEIRNKLKERGIEIPHDTWFMGGEHNTCDDTITWYDVDSIPDVLRDHYEKLKQNLYAASKSSAHERCRRFASAPKDPSDTKALQHVIARSMDFSQARPELGHATNAAAFIGRRYISQGAFFDRRVFLISYDSRDDVEGKILEAILLAAGPVGAGINLEYYFSTVNNEQYGCGSKIMHNIMGLFGVMEGTSSDLRTGLPKQMIEIHEAMRLQVVVEATTEILTEIYMRQPPLQELIGNGWLLLSACDPVTGKISVFELDKGFVPWDAAGDSVPEVECSTDWYRGHINPLPPALIKGRQSA
ncbi:MAG: DUF2309 domain-containing protein [Gammaproteobacteria bacterium]|nr:DUF2309 domain-containing protein [Gammaproteobacteria bacterium]